MTSESNQIIWASCATAPVYNVAMELNRHEQHFEENTAEMLTKYGKIRKKPERTLRFSACVKMIKTVEPLTEWGVSGWNRMCRVGVDCGT